MKKSLMTLGLIAGLFVAEVAKPCSCAPPGTPDKELERSTAVFAGRVTKLERVVSEHGFPSVQVTFDVSRTWKGVKSSVVKVGTSQSSAACGYGFRLGVEYIVYAYGDSVEDLRTSLCTRNNELAKAEEDLRVLGPGEKPENE